MVTFGIWPGVVSSDLERFGELGGGKLPVCEEVNAPAPQDGGRPGCYDALAAGLTGALEKRDSLGADILVGFNAAAAPPRDPFWSTVRSHVDPAVLPASTTSAWTFPRRFHPIPPASLPQAVNYMVRSFRDAATAIGVPATVQLHITETGPPTGPEHSEDEQARVIGIVAEAVLELTPKPAFNVAKRLVTVYSK